MSYKKHRYGSTKIKGKRIDNLSIGWDYYRTHKSRFPVFLFTPDMEDTNTHYHIKLDRLQARKLKDWLEDFLEDTAHRARTKTK